jgi:hypothetical protein
VVEAPRRVDRDALPHGIGRNHGHREGILKRSCARWAEVARAPVHTRGLLVVCLSGSRGASGDPVRWASCGAGIYRDQRVRRSWHPGYRGRRLVLLSLGGVSPSGPYQDAAASDTNVGTGSC